MTLALIIAIISAYLTKYYSNKHKQKLILIEWCDRYSTWDKLRLCIQNQLKYFSKNALNHYDAKLNSNFGDEFFDIDLDNNLSSIKKISEELIESIPEIIKPIEKTFIEIELEKILQKYKSIKDEIEIRKYQIFSQRLETWTNKTAEILALEIQDQNDFYGDYATVKALLRQNRINYKVAKQKYKMALQLERSEAVIIQNNAIYKLDPKIIIGPSKNENNLVHKCQEIAKIYKVRRVQMKKALFLANHFEQSINKILNWLKNTEGRLAKIQRIVDGEKTETNNKNLADIAIILNETQRAQDLLSKKFFNTLNLGQQLLKITKFKQSSEILNKWITAMEFGWLDVNSWLKNLKMIFPEKCEDSKDSGISNNSSIELFQNSNNNKFSDNLQNVTTEITAKMDKLSSLQQIDNENFKLGFQESLEMVKIVDKKIKVRNSGSWIDLETFLKIKDQEP